MVTPKTVEARKKISPSNASLTDYYSFFLLAKLPNIDEAYYGHTSRAVAPTCIEGTRDSLLKKYRAWSIDLEPDSARVFWVRGPSGVGKSAVAQTISEGATDEKHICATFFFTALEQRRHLPDAVFTTLIQQILNNPLCPPSIKGSITRALQKNPTIGSESIETHFQTLIVEPLSDIRQFVPVILILDGLDECTEAGTTEILGLIKSNLQRLPRYLKVFVTSRPDGHITTTIRSLQRGNDVKAHQIQIHEMNPSEDKDDVRIYLNHELSEFKVPGLAGRGSLREKVEAVVENSEGHFGFAATVVRDVVHKNVANPKARLDALLEGFQPNIQTSTPMNRLTQQILDAKYPTTNNTVVLERFRRVIGTIVLLAEPLSVESLGELLQEKSKKSVPSVLSDLHALVAPNPSDHLIRPLHSSFVDFVTDKDACPVAYYIDREAHHARLAILCLNTMNELFDESLGSEVDLTPHTSYVLRYCVDHVTKSSLDGMLEVFQLMGHFLKLYLAKWMSTLNQIRYLEHASSLVQRLCDWLVSDGH